MAVYLKPRAIGTGQNPGTVVDQIKPTSTTEAPSGRAVNARLSVIEQAIVLLQQQLSALTGQASGVATAAGNVTVAPGAGGQALVGAAAGAGTASGGLSAAKPLVGAAAGAGAASGGLSATKPVAATAAGVATAGGGASVTASAPAPPAGALRWSDPATWGGALPTASSPILIQIGTTILLDVPNALAGSLEIAGTLLADYAVDVGLTANSVNVLSTGRFEIGNVAAPYLRQATLTLAGVETGLVPRFVADQTGAAGAGNGVLTRLHAVAGAIAETITVTWTSPTAFVVTGNISGNLGNGTVGAVFNNRVRFIAVAGLAAWANGDTRTIAMRGGLGFNNDGMPRSLQKQPGGQLRFVGEPVPNPYLRINAHIAANSSTIQLASVPTGWTAGKEIIVGPTDFWGTPQGAVQKLVIQSIIGSVVTTTTPVAGGRWGLMQYVRDTGMALSPGTLTGKPHVDCPETLDQRAVVQLITRNIVVQGADDAAWTNRIGGHTMGMGLAGAYVFKGVQFRRMGQHARNGRYPIHWHMPSYAMPDGMTLPSDGTFLGDVDPLQNFVDDCSFDDCAHRGITLHGVCGATARNNVMSNITGHALFFEDGAERRNTVRNNVIYDVREPTTPILPSDVNGEFGGASGIWLTHPNNIVEDNIVGGATVGIWNVFGRKPFGLCQNVATVPIRSPLGSLDRNIAHSNRRAGMRTRDRVLNNAGDVNLIDPLMNSDFLGSMYAPVLNEQPYSINYAGPYPVPNTVETITSGVQLWKNGEGGYTQTFAEPIYTGWIEADNVGIDYTGKTQDGALARRGLDIGTSLNNANTPNTRDPFNPRTAFQTYHETLNFENMLVVNFPNMPMVPEYGGAGNNPIGGGTFRFSDLYLQPQQSFVHSTGLRLINSGIGTRSLPPALDGAPLGNRNWTYSGALYDADGKFTGTVGRSWVFDDPFYTHGLSDAVPVPNNIGVQTATRYIGIRGVYSDANEAVTYVGNIYTSHITHNFTRQNGAGATVGTANIANGNANSVFGNMRHAALANGGRFTLSYGADPLPTRWVQFEAMAPITFPGTLRTMVRIPYAATAPIVGCWRSTNYSMHYRALNSTGGPTAAELSGGQGQTITAAASFAAVEASSGELYFRDGDGIWFNVAGGLTAQTNENPFSDRAKYPTIYYKIVAA